MINSLKRGRPTLRFVCVVLKFIEIDLSVQVDIKITTGSTDDSTDEIPTTTQVITGLKDYCETNKSYCESFTGSNNTVTDLLTVNGM